MGLDLDLPRRINEPDLGVSPVRGLTVPMFREEAKGMLSVGVALQSRRCRFLSLYIEVMWLPGQEK